jgi:NitT/TauT family transport system substrate-binding protein
MYWPLYLATCLGFYEDEGLDVEHVIISGSGAVHQQLIAGGVDITTSGNAAALNAVASGQDIVEVYTYYYQNINELAAPVGGPVTKLEDLKGKVVGISEPSGGEVPFVRGVLNSVGLAENVDYTMLTVGEGGPLTYEALKNGDAQAYSSSIFDVGSLANFGMELQTIVPDQFKFVPSIGGRVMRSYLDANRDTVVGFYRAVAKATIFGEANPAAADWCAKEHGPELYEDPKVPPAFFEATKTLLTPPDGFDRTRLGEHYREGFEQYIEFVSQGTVEEGALPGPVDLDKHLDSSLLDDINDFDVAAVKAEAAAWTAP